MSWKTSPTWIAAVAGIVALVSSGYLFVSAAATASLRFWYCGPSSLDHQDPQCRIATKLLLTSYGMGLLAVGLGVLTVCLHVRRLKGADKPSEPNPHRGSA
jgi:hypothetical protein